MIYRLILFPRKYPEYAVEIIYTPPYSSNTISMNITICVVSNDQQLLKIAIMNDCLSYIVTPVIV